MEERCNSFLSCLLLLECVFVSKLNILMKVCQPCNIKIFYYAQVSECLGFFFSCLHCGGP